MKRKAEIETKSRETRKEQRVEVVEVEAAGAVKTRERNVTKLKEAEAEAAQHCPEQSSRAAEHPLSQAKNKFLEQP